MHVYRLWDKTRWSEACIFSPEKKILQWGSSCKSRIIKRSFEMLSLPSHVSFVNPTPTMIMCSVVLMIQQEGNTASKDESRKQKCQDDDADNFLSSSHNKSRTCSTWRKMDFLLLIVSSRQQQRKKKISPLATYLVLCILMYQVWCEYERLTPSLSSEALILSGSVSLNHQITREREIAGQEKCDVIVDLKLEGKINSSFSHSSSQQSLLFLRNL
jgi:hypothetical protein